MVFACQRDSFLKKLSSKVVSCNEAKLTRMNDGKKEVVEGFEVVLEDTILFPEGGGQPWDLGTIDGKEVLQVIRRGTEAVHFLLFPLKEGQTVSVDLNWGRRFDHMQQHSGQHLITAVVDSEYGFGTSSWWLGEEISFVELDTPSMSSDQVVHVEKLVNQHVRDAKVVSVKVYEASDAELKKARTRGLPEDHVGLVRIVTIENLESNMCCGTHVSNLSQLQLIKLTGVEKGKKNKVRLNFIVGNRVIKKLDEFLVREASITSLLQNKGSMHVQLVEKLQESLKTATKNLQNILRELAVTEATKLKNLVPKPKYFILHRREAEIDYINTFLREFNDESILVVLLVGDEPNIQLVLHGRDFVQAIGTELCELMEGKGFSKGPRFQAKVTRIRLAQAESIIKANLDKNPV